MAIFASYWSGASLEFIALGKISKLLAPMVLVPLIIGIVGVKTDRSSWASFCGVYAFFMSFLYFTKLLHSGKEGILYEEAYFYDSFVLASFLGLLAFFTAHIIKNRGIVTLRRSKATISERLWMPWSSMVQSVKGWLSAPLRWPILANKKIGYTPAQPLSFSMAIFTLYTFSSIITHGGANDLGLANFMATVHGVGIVLCVGLMLKGLWPARIKPYFGLYWFFTLLYCLPFGGTLAFLRAHVGPMSGVQWLSTFILLAVLVEGATFLGLTFLGCSLAFGGWYIAKGTFPIDLWQNETNLIVLVLLFVLMAAVFLFGRKRKKRLLQKSIDSNDKRYLQEKIAPKVRVVFFSFLYI